MRTRDYQNLTDIIRILPVKQRSSVALHFAEELKKQRTNFKTEIFLQAAGYKAQEDEE